MVHLTRSRVAISGSIIAIFTIARVVFDQTAISALQRQAEEVTYTPAVGGATNQAKASQHEEQRLPTPVLILGYMRGGSSFMGDVFNQYQGSFYWYEPLDGVYSALFGTPYGWTPLDITHTLDGEPRRLSNTEEEAIVRSLLDIYQCQFRRLPVEVLTHRFVDGAVSYAHAEFVSCLYSSDSFPTRSSDDCKAELQSVCPQSFEDPRIYTCHQFLHRGLPNVTRATQQTESNATVDEDTGSVFTDAQIDRFYEHNRCLENVRRNAASCLVSLERKCRHSRTAVVKTIRMRMRTVELLLRHLPDLRVLHVLREPVPMVLSRYRNKLMSASSGGMVITEAVVMCSKIADDIRERHRLEAETLRRLGTHNFLTVYLDQFAKDPLGALDVVYRHALQMARPGDATLWVQETYKHGGDQFEPCSNATSTFTDDEREEFAMEYCYEGFLQNLRKACEEFYTAVKETHR